LLLYGLMALAAGLLIIGSDRFWDLLSPITHKQQLYALAGEYKVDPMLLAAIVRAESTFNPFAESRSGAVGLMQLMPDTAEEAARGLHLDFDKVEDLYQDEVNLRLGTYHFAHLLKAFNGDTVLALAAYNAGAAKVRNGACRRPARRRPTASKPSPWTRPATMWRGCWPATAPSRSCSASSAGFKD